MKLQLILLLLVSLVAISCGGNKDNKTGKTRRTASFATPESIETQGLYFRVIREPYWPNRSRVELRCKTVAGKTNNHKVRVLTELFEKNRTIRVGSRTLSEFVFEDLVNQAIRVLEWDRHSIECPFRSGFLAREF